MVSLLDIIGPVMVGPSSSHTAGACTLGLLARGLVGGTPQSALLELHGSFARTGEGHGTDKALVAGLLGFRPDDERIRTSLGIADGKGLAYRFEKTTIAEDSRGQCARDRRRRPGRRTGDGGIHRGRDRRARIALRGAAIEMALGGIEFAIPVDEVIDVMGLIGREMDARYRETAGGGLAATPTGRRLAKERLYQIRRL